MDGLYRNMDVDVGEEEEEEKEVPWIMQNRTVHAARCEQSV